MINKSDNSKFISYVLIYTTAISLHEGVLPPLQNVFVMYIMAMSTEGTRRAHTDTL